jgi:FkbM family methyltransferase
LISILKFFLRRPYAVAKRVFLPNPDKFLKNVTGVFHVGANSGQERHDYRRGNLRVIWVEPIPSVFDELRENLEGFPDQKAFEYLLTDVDGEEYDFNIANNGGASSSILNFALHEDIWPDVQYVDTIKLSGTTLKTMVERESIDLGDYQALIMDTQGSELMVLKGAGPLLHKFKFIKTEAADFEAYEGCCLLSELTEYLEKFGFREVRRTRMAKHEAGGQYFDVVFENQSQQGMSERSALAV